jgi:hypothetical protein
MGSLLDLRQVCDALTHSFPLMCGTEVATSLGRQRHSPVRLCVRCVPMGRGLLGPLIGGRGGTVAGWAGELMNLQTCAARRVYEPVGGEGIVPGFFLVLSMSLLTLSLRSVVSR